MSLMKHFDFVFQEHSKCKLFRHNCTVGKGKDIIDYDRIKIDLLSSR